MIFFLYCGSTLASNCDDKAYRQFDFWLGKWQVTTHTDKIIRHNKISLINDGCTLLEEYSTPSGYAGKSFNIYDKQHQTWHQTWVDNSGLLLQLDGKKEGNQMILSGYSIQDDNRILNRITWTDNKNGSVRQHWEIKQSNTKTWETIFDGLYTKMPAN